MPKENGLVLNLECWNESLHAFNNWDWSPRFMLRTSQKRMPIRFRRERRKTPKFLEKLWFAKRIKRGLPRAARTWCWRLSQQFSVQDVTIVISLHIATSPNQAFQRSRFWKCMNCTSSFMKAGVLAWTGRVRTFKLKSAIWLSPSRHDCQVPSLKWWKSCKALRNEIHDFSHAGDSNEIRTFKNKEISASRKPVPQEGQGSYGKFAVSKQFLSREQLTNWCLALFSSNPS